MRSYVIVDVFTDVPLEGNPVAVFTDGAGLGDELMQRAARELNLSETVFLLEPEAGSEDDAADAADAADARARIFTPLTELPFAGHPVLGTAFVLGERRVLDTVRLQTGAGLIEIALTREGDRIASGEMIQPVPECEPLGCASEVLTALGVERSALPVEVYDNGVRHAFVALDDEAAVAGLAPDLVALGRLGSLGVSCFTSSGPRVKTRMFAPGLGVSEDPATGSAAGPLAVHLARHGRTRFGEWIEIQQGAEIGRPSVLRAVAEDQGGRVKRVRVAGGAVEVAHGEFQLD